jgi:hypothetical protein
MTASVRVSDAGRLGNGAACSAAGVRKPPREETAGRDTWVVRPDGRWLLEPKYDYLSTGSEIFVASDRRQARDIARRDAGN